MISMSRNGRRDASSSLLLAIAVACMVGASLLAFAMSASGSEGRAPGIKSKTITIHTWQDSAGVEMVRVNETDKVVTLTEAGVTAGWTVTTLNTGSIY